MHRCNWRSHVRAALTMHHLKTLKKASRLPRAPWHLLPLYLCPQSQHTWWSPCAEMCNQHPCFRGFRHPRLYRSHGDALTTLLLHSLQLQEHWRAVLCVCFAWPVGVEILNHCFNWSLSSLIQWLSISTPTWPGQNCIGGTYPGPVELMPCIGGSALPGAPRPK